MAVNYYHNVDAYTVNKYMIDKFCRLIKTIEPTKQKSNRPTTYMTVCDKYYNI